MYETRKFTIVETTELDKVNFNEILETSAETARKSVDGSLAVLKWDGEEVPASVKELKTIKGYYNYNEILTILSTNEWTIKQENMMK